MSQSASDTRMTGSVLLVGSVPGKDAAEAMSTCAHGLGGYLDCLPDGETGLRRIWINFLAAMIYDGNPGLATVSRPHPVDAEDPEEWRNAGEDWVPRGYHDHWQFQIKPDHPAVRFEHLGYAEEAAKSYDSFCALKRAGTIPPHLRFMVALPLTESAVRPFFARASDFQAMWNAYEEAMSREIPKMLKHIPASDLAIQWDICMEALAVECNDRHSELFPYKPEGDAFERYLKAVTAISAFVPEEALMGLHLCYGDLGHRHFIEPPDLGVVTRMANAATEAIERTVDFYHVPVPRDRSDDAYFQPLKNFDAGHGKLYLGLVHHTDGVPGSLQRLEAAKKYYSEFGIATECGFGRRPKETIPELLRIHREVADVL